MLDYKNNEIITMLASKNNTVFNDIIYYLKQKMTARIYKLIIDRGGTKEDAEECFNDALLVATQYAKSDRFKTGTDVMGFVYTVARNRHKPKPTKNEPMLDKVYSKADSEYSSEIDEMIEKLHKVIKLLNIDCQKILTAFYFERKSMKEIMQLFNLSSVQVAKTKKLRCMKYLKQHFLD